MSKKVLIIGSGLGGMSAAIHLANAGFEVEVFESQSFPGGKVGLFEKDGFRFDTGPSLVTMPLVLEELFRVAGYELRDYLTVRPLDVLTKYFYPDGTVINAYADQEKFAEEIEAKTSDSKTSIHKFLNYSKKIYEATADIFIFGSLEKFFTLKGFLNPKNILLIPKLLKVDAFRAMHQAISSFFKDPKTIQIFDRFATYNGSNPFRAPATLNVIAHVEHGIGGYYTENGIYEIPKALFKLAEMKGVKFHFNSTVEKIVTKDKKVAGIEVSAARDQSSNQETSSNRAPQSTAKFIPCENIISNVDVVTTYEKLLNTPTKYSNQEPSTSVLVFNWGIKGIYENLDIHNILFSSNYEHECDLTSSGFFPEDKTIYINISSKYSKKDAPENCENWFVLVNMPALKVSKEEIQKTKVNILKKIKEFTGIDLKGKIIIEEILTPQLLEERTGSYLGALYGPSSNSKFSAFLRQQSKPKDFEGLYFCGGSAHPGGGIPLVIKSGQFAAESIILSSRA